MGGSLVEAYLRGEAKDFFSSHPAIQADRLAAVKRALRPLQPEVAEELLRQNAQLPPSQARDAHLSALAGGAAAVVTGQQVGLFLGPLFTVYKAATAVQVARALAEETGERVVPVFWLQTEDHDLPEISTCGLPSDDGGVTEVGLPASASARTSIAHVVLPEEVLGALERLASVLAELPHGSAHLERLSRHYLPGAGWADAFAGVLAELFAPEGLVFVQPRTPALARAGAPIHRRALEKAEPIARRLMDRCTALEGAGFSSAVHVRDGAPLSFFHPRGPKGPRYRLDAHLREVGGEGQHRLSELLSKLEAEPLAFSTSALLRPVLQDALLPTAAYVGGPGELAYFAQLGPLYEDFGLRMPLVVSRAQLRVVEPRSRRLCQKLGVSAAEAALPEEALLARCVRGAAELPDGSALSRALLEPFEATLLRLAAPLASELHKPLRRTQESVHRAVEAFIQRYQAARLRRDEGVVRDVARLKALLHPGGVPQERVHGLPYYGARYGDRAFAEKVLAGVRPFEPGMGDLEP